MDRLTESDRTLASLRKILLATLLLGMAGTAGELLLLEHTGDGNQLIPLVLLGLGLVAAAWIMFGSSRLSLRALQVLMLGFAVSGLLGMVLHFQANREFQTEVDPGLAGSNLLWAILQAKAPPALAPGTMTLLGLIGLAYAYRHPAFAPGHRILEENRDV